MAVHLTRDVAKDEGDILIMKVTIGLPVWVTRVCRTAGEEPQLKASFYSYRYRSYTDKGFRLQKDSSLSQTYDSNICDLLMVSP